MALDIVIMAAGKGTRMKSRLPKVLHTLAGRPLLQHVLDTAGQLGRHATTVVVGHAAERVEPLVAAAGARAVRQQPQLGTGHAVAQALPYLGVPGVAAHGDPSAGRAGEPGRGPSSREAEGGTTLILNGDVPLIAASTARALVDACAGERLALLTIELAEPAGYGRIVRGSDGAVRGIVEHKDAAPEQLAIREVYTGIMAAPTASLKRWVGALSNDNAQGEYYLTDIVAMAVAEGVPVVARRVADETEVLGVNSPHQLADLERRLQRRHADALLDAGVRLADPARFDLRGTLQAGQDVEIDVGCIFEGRVVLGDDVRIGAHCLIRDAVIERGAVIHPYTHIDGARVGPGALVGPYARLRHGADLGREVHVGNFVEVKNATLSTGAKANHLAYLGDATVGERVNFGAGSITANYDGANKHRTVIGDDAHIGSNCVLIAPVNVGAGGTVGGGSTIAKDTPAGQLTVARARQVSISGWTRPTKAKKA